MINSTEQIFNSNPDYDPLAKLQAQQHITEDQAMVTALLMLGLLVGLGLLLAASLLRWIFR